MKEAELNRRRQRARQRAFRALAAQHRHEFDQLLAAEYDMERLPRKQPKTLTHRANTVTQRNNGR